MTDINQITQVVNQLAGMGVDLAKTMTPLALMAAKMAAIKQLAWESPLMILALFGFIAGILIGRNPANTRDEDAIAFFCMLLGGIGCVWLGMYIFMDVYGLFHPDAYLAYQALNKITGG